MSCIKRNGKIYIGNIFTTIKDCNTTLSKCFDLNDYKLIEALKLLYKKAQKSS